jgi:hypothetical protein
MFVISGISKQWRVWRYPRGNQQYIYKVQHVLFALFLFVYVQWRPTLIVLCFCFVCFRLVYPMLLLIRKLLNQSHPFERFTVATMTWLTVMEYLCHKWPRICSTCRKHFPIPSSLMTYHGFVTRLTRRVSLVEQELLTLPEILNSPPVFGGVHVTRSAVLFVCCLSFCTFSFGQCVVCTSSIYRFSLPLSYPQTPFTTIDGVVDHHCLNFLFLIGIETKRMAT